MSFRSIEEEYLNKYRNTQGKKIIYNYQKLVLENLYENNNVSSDDFDLANDFFLEIKEGFLLGKGYY